MKNIKEEILKEFEKEIDCDWGNDPPKRKGKLLTDQYYPESEYEVDGEKVKEFIAAAIDKVVKSCPTRNKGIDHEENLQELEEIKQWQELR